MTQIIRTDGTVVSAEVNPFNEVYYFNGFYTKATLPDNTSVLVRKLGIVWCEISVDEILELFKNGRTDPNFASFKKPIQECSDEELTSWYIQFLDCADPDLEINQRWYREFKDEVLNRSDEFRHKVDLIDENL